MYTIKFTTAFKKSYKLMKKHGLAKLISLLLRDGKTDEIAKVAEDETLREQYYQRYGIDKNAE